MFISLGHNCHPSWNLRKLNLQKYSLPFDWLLCHNYRTFEYVNNMINTNFSNFTNNLIYNHRKKVISKNFDYVEFFHHDLIKNITIGMPQDDNKNLIDTMNNRAKRFIDIISNENNEIIFLCMLDHSILTKDGLNNNDKLYQDMLNFDNNLNIKCKFKVLVYFVNDDGDYNLIIPYEFNNLKNFIFDKYIRNTSVCKIFGNINDFKNLLERNKLL